MHAERHIPSLDGLRGAGVLLVMARHLTLVTWFRESPNPADRAVSAVAGVGWIAVDMFFVLSGYLITGILLRERDRPAPAGAKFARFYWRRVLRIFPVYYAACAVLFIVLPALPYFGAQPETATLRQHAAWYWLYGVNLLEVARGAASTPYNTGHFWSLAVEEQFYLIWPFVVLSVSPRTLRRAVVAMLVAGPLARVACLLWVHEGVQAAMVLPIARVDVLAVGAILALVERSEDATVRAAARRVGLWGAAIGGGAWLTLAALGDAGDPYAPLTQTVGYTAVALGMGALIGSAAGVWDGTPRVARWFSARSLRAAGRYSYALYVVHYPLMAVVDLAWARVRIPALFGSMLPAWLAYAAALLLPSFGIAWLSWRLVESRMLALKGRLPFGARPSAPRAA